MAGYFAASCAVFLSAITFLKEYHKSNTSVTQLAVIFRCIGAKQIGAYRMERLATRDMVLLSVNCSC